MKVLLACVVAVLFMACHVDAFVGLQPQRLHRQRNNGMSLSFPLTSSGRSLLKEGRRMDDSSRTRLANVTPKKLIQGLPEIAWNSTKSAVSEFFEGAMEVHNRYLEIWWKVTWAKLRFGVLTTLTFAALTYWLGDTWISQFRVAIMKIVFYAGWICCLPIGVMIGLPLGLILRRPIKKVFRICCVPPTFGFGVDNTEMYMQTLQKFKGGPSGAFLMLLYLAIEEVVYRWGTYGIWRWGRRQEATVGESHSQGTNEDGDEKAEEETKAGIINNRSTNTTKKWIIVSSLIFAGAHTLNHLPGLSPSAIKEQVKAGIAMGQAEIAPNELPPDYVTAIANSFEFILNHRALSSSLLQGLCTYLIATQVFAPIFLKRGLLASIGAHLCWNSFLLFTPTSLQVIGRLTVRWIGRRGKLLSFRRRRCDDDPPKNNSSTGKKTDEDKNDAQEKD